MNRGNQFGSQSGSKKFTAGRHDGGSGSGQAGSWTQATVKQPIAQGNTLTGPTHYFEEQGDEKVAGLSATQVEALYNLFKEREKQEKMSGKSLCVANVK